MESSWVLAVGTLLGERGGNVGLKQVEKNEFTISAFSSLVLAVILPWFRTGMELCFLLRYFTADQNFLLLPLGFRFLKLNIRSLARSCNTPLHIACMYKHLELVTFLVEDRQCSQSVKNQRGELPLHIACHSKQDSAVEMIKLVSSKCQCSNTIR